MRRIITSVALLTACAAQAATTHTPATATPSFELALLGGYAGGLGGELALLGQQLAGTPLGVRGWAALSATDGFNDDAPCGEAGAAGTVSCGRFFKELAGFPNEGGRNVFVGADILYRVTSGDVGQGSVSAYLGPRFNAFTSTLQGESGSLTFSTSQFGVGGGLLATLPVAREVRLVADVGVDRYFKAPITGRSSAEDDTVRYTPGEPRYTDVDRFVNQPGTILRALLGFSYRF